MKPARLSRLTEVPRLLTSRRTASKERSAPKRERSERMKSAKLKLVLTAIVLLALLPTLGQAQGTVPATVSYQGRVTVGGAPFNGTGYFKFAVVQSDGWVSWSNDGAFGFNAVPTTAVPLNVSNGLLNVLLGDTSLTGMTQALAYYAFADPVTLLRVWFSSDGSTFTQLPDRPISSVPYAIYAEDAASVNGMTAYQFAWEGHNHWAETWSGSSTGLTLNSSGGGPALNVSSGDNDGIYVPSAGGDGVEVHAAGEDGLRVGTTGDDGVQIGFQTWLGDYVGAGDDGIVIYDAGNAPTHTLPVDALWGNTNDGIDIAGAKDFGLWVGYAGKTGLVVNDSGGDGVSIHTAGTDGVWVSETGQSGFAVTRAGANGVWVGAAGDDGLNINQAGDDGIDIYDAGNAPTHTLPSDVGWGNTHDGIDIAGAKDFGVWIGHAGTGLHIHESRNNGIEMESVAGVGVLVDEAGEKGFVVTDSHGDGLQIGYELFGLYHGAGDDGIEIWDAGNAPTHIMPEDTAFGDTKDGIDIAGAKDFGLWIGYAGRDGVYVESAGNDGIVVGAPAQNGIFVARPGDDGLEIGYQMYGMYYGPGGDGIRIWDVGDVSTDDHRLPSDAGWGSTKDGIEINGAEDFGLWVGYAGNSGVWVEAAEGIGVQANTLNQYGYWGFYTPDRIYAGTALASGGPLMLVAQNGDGRNLEAGDVVAVSGVGALFADGDSPVTLVQKASQANSAAAVGVVYRRFVAEEEVKEAEYEGVVERQTRIGANSTEGSIAPGEYLLIVVLGPAQVKTDASMGSIRPGDLLTASGTNGQAMKAEPVKVGGVEFYAPGTIIGKAMEPLDAAQGTDLIWALVTLQ